MESTGYTLPNQPPPESEPDSGYRYADPEQILRSHQRDNEHVSRLGELVTDVARNFRGSRWVLARGETLQVLSKLLYYGLTFGAASQTLGEEYVEILPYAIKRSNFPSRIRRILSVLSLALLPSLWRHLCKTLTPAHQTGPETRRTKLARILNNEWIQRVPEAWFIWFLLRGRNVEWSKSLWGMRYITAVPERRGGVRGYEAVGFVMAIPLLARLISQTFNNRTPTAIIDPKPTSQPTQTLQTHQYKIDNNTLTTHLPPQTILPATSLTIPDRQCPLCLSPRGVAPESGGTCVTECGHVFCWGCIQEWGHEKSMHAAARDETITRSRQRNQGSQSLKPFSPGTVGSANGAGRAQAGPSNGAGTGNGGSKPIMEWFRKLGHGMRSDPPGAGSRGNGNAPSMRSSVGKNGKEKSFRAQASSSIGLAAGRGGRKQQGMTSSETRRRASHHSSSVKSSKSVRSTRQVPPFSPPRTSSFARFPRAPTFMTRSSRSPASSLISSPASSRRGSTEHSLAGSYLGVNDPDARSFVPSVMADEDASLRPFPPSPGRRSSVVHSTRSTSSTDGIRAASRLETISPRAPQQVRRDSQSTTATTQSSLGASRTWTNDGASRTRSIDTRPTTILGSLDFLPQRAAHIAQPHPHPSLSVRGVTQIHRTLTWDSGLSASPSVPSPLATSITANRTQQQQQQANRRSILERPLERPSPASSSPPSTTSFYPCHVPRHSHPHPRDNPRPFSPPEANASLVTLASSEFAQSGRAARVGSEGDLLGPPLELVGEATPRMGQHEYDLTPGLDDEDDEEIPDRYTADQTPVMGDIYAASPNDTASSSRHRAVSYFDRASSYYFNPTSNPAANPSSSIHTSGPRGTHLNASLRSHDDRSGWDDRASVTAMRRRGSWESGESSFSGAGAAPGGMLRGSFSLASVHARYSPSLNFPPRDGGVGDSVGAGAVGPSGLSQSLGRLSVVERPEVAAGVFT